MDVLVKFAKYAKEEPSGLENEFDSIKEVQEYFLNLSDKEGNDNFFFIIKKERLDEEKSTGNILKNKDNVYFFFKGKIIAKAKYVKMPNPKKSDYFKNGYKVKNVLLLASPFPLKKLKKLHSKSPVYYIKEDDKKLKKGLKKLFK